MCFYYIFIPTGRKSSAKESLAGLFSTIYKGLYTNVVTKCTAERLFAILIETGVEPLISGIFVSALI